MNIQMFLSVAWLGKGEKTPLRLPISGSNHTAPLTSWRDHQTLCKLHTDSPGLLAYLQHKEVTGTCILFFFFTLLSFVVVVVTVPTVFCSCSPALREGRRGEVGRSILKVKVVLQLTYQHFGAITF